MFPTDGHESTREIVITVTTQEEMGIPEQLVNTWLTSFQQTAMAASFVELGIPDLLKDGPKSSLELAEATETVPDKLLMLLQAVASLDTQSLLTQNDDDFELTPMGALLQADAPDSVQPIANLFTAEWIRKPWQEGLTHSLRTGESAFQHVYGTTAWEYRNHDPEAARVFNAGMTALSKQDIPIVLSAYDFSSAGQTIVDVGGGRGAFLAAILTKYPQKQGVLFDMPEVMATAEPLIAQAKLTDRCSLVGGSFLDSVPENGDLYNIKRVLLNWGDEEYVKITGNCHKAMGEKKGKLLIMEPVLQEDLPKGKQLFNPHMLSLHMLVMQGGGHLRSKNEHEALLEKAGFRIQGIVPTAALSIIEAEPV